MDKIMQEIYQAVIAGQKDEVEIGIQNALGAGIPAEKILHDGLIPPMTEVGRLFEQGEYYVPEMLISARAMQAGLAILKPQLAEANVKAVGKVAIGTVKGDLHDIGKNLVAMMLEGAGFEIIDLGTDVSPEKFVESVSDGGVDIIGLSALLTTTMPSMATTIKALEDAGVRDQVKVIVGGAPVTDAYAEQVGADGFSPDASRAVTLAKSLLNL